MNQSIPNGIFFPSRANEQVSTCPDLLFTEWFFFFLSSFYLWAGSDSCELLWMISDQGKAKMDEWMDGWSQPCKMDRSILDPLDKLKLRSMIIAAAAKKSFNRRKGNQGREKHQEFSLKKLNSFPMSWGDFHKLNHPMWGSKMLFRSCLPIQKERNK